MICAGDYSKRQLIPNDRKAKAEYEKALNAFKALPNKYAAITTHGNHDSEKPFNEVFGKSNKVKYVHDNRTARTRPEQGEHELEFTGFGGVELPKNSQSPALDGMLLGVSHYSYETIFDSVCRGLEEKSREGKLYDTVLLTHQTPYGLLDCRKYDKFRKKLPEEKYFKGGSKAVRDALNTYSPFLVASGHTHEDPGLAVRECPDAEPMQARYDIKRKRIDISAIDQKRLADAGMRITDYTGDSITFGIESSARGKPTFYLNPGSLGQDGMTCDVDLELQGRNQEFERVIRFKFASRI